MGRALATVIVLVQLFVHAGHAQVQSSAARIEGELLHLRSNAVQAALMLDIDSVERILGELEKKHAEYKSVANAGSRIKKPIREFKFLDIVRQALTNRFSEAVERVKGAPDWDKDTKSKLVKALGIKKLGLRLHEISSDPREIVDVFKQLDTERKTLILSGGLGQSLIQSGSFEALRDYLRPLGKEERNQIFGYWLDRRVHEKSSPEFLLLLISMDMNFNDVVDLPLVSTKSAISDLDASHALRFAEHCDTTGLLLYRIAHGFGEKGSLQAERWLYIRNHLASINFATKIALDKQAEASRMATRNVLMSSDPDVQIDAKNDLDLDPEDISVNDVHIDLNACRTALRVADPNESVTSLIAQIFQKNQVLDWVKALERIERIATRKGLR